MQLIGHTKTEVGLRVRSKLDKRKYSTGVVTTDEEMRRALDYLKHITPWVLVTGVMQVEGKQVKPGVIA